MFTQIGKTLIFIGLAVIVLGFLFISAEKLTWLGRLPGDIHFQKKNFSFYFPLTSCILASIILSFLFWVFHRR
ncbi:MAG: DUF2905 domain-containing protein [Candidatus Omnitrophota bacterium]